MPLLQASLTPQFCGGSNTDDKMSPKKMTSQMATVGFCQRMRLNDYGIKQGWQTEGMPSPRFMGEAIIMPDGKLMLVNGAQTGVSGFNNIGSMTGNSNADNPVLQPWIYDPLATRGSRFSRTGMPTSKIPRMYHSTATVRAQTWLCQLRDRWLDRRRARRLLFNTSSRFQLLPDGRVMVAGSCVSCMASLC